jgi:hypothetical protein
MDRGRDGRRKAGGSREVGEISDDSSGTLSPPSADDDDPAPQDTGPIDAEDMPDVFFDISGKDATTLETVHDFARYLGIDPVADKAFLWIAVEAMVAQLPANWAEYKTVDGQTYYYNERLGVTQWEHPMDDYHRCLFLRLKAKGADNRGKERKSKSKDQHSGKQVEKGKERGSGAAEDGKSGRALLAKLQSLKKEAASEASRRQELDLQHISAAADAAGASHQKGEAGEGKRGVGGHALGRGDQTERRGDETENRGGDVRAARRELKEREDRLAYERAEKEKEKEKEAKEKEKEALKLQELKEKKVCVCVCVCVKEKEKEK